MHQNMDQAHHWNIIQVILLLLIILGTVLIMKIYGDEMVVNQINNDHVRQDIMCLQVENGNVYMIIGILQMQ